MRSVERSTIQPILADHRGRRALLATVVIGGVSVGVSTVAAGLIGSLAARDAHAQAADFPSRPLKFLVPFPPGSGTDTGARYFGKKISEITGQPVVVENRPGANGFIAVQAVLSAPADGYTVFVGSNSTLATNAALFKKLPYDPVADFTPLSILSRAPVMLIVPPNSPFKSIAELVDAARKQPGKLNYASGSAGYQLMSEMFNETAKVEIMAVPYKGASEAISAVASGNADFAVVDITGAIELARSGRVRALAIASEARSAEMPNIPTAIEAGLPGYTAFTWVAAMAPAKTPKPITDRLSELFVKVLAMPETRDYFARLNADLMPGGPAAMRTFQLAEIERWKRIAKNAKVEQE